jgi:DNA repair exonuclease SbcCD ATPase subunit
MKIQHIRAKGFLSLGDVRVDFTPGLCLLEGDNQDESYFESNGAGKTALVESLIWCLYGETIRPAKVKDVVGWHTDYCWVETNLWLGDRHICIERHRTKGKTEIRIEINEKDETRHTVEQNQALINDLLGISKDRFLQTVILEGGMRGRFSDLTDMARKDLIEGLIGAKVWETAYRNALAALREHEKQLEVYRASVTGKKDLATQERLRAQELRDRLGKPKDAPPDLTPEIEGMQAELPALRQELERVVKRREFLQQTLAESEPALAKEKEQLSTLEQEVAVMRSDVERYETLMAEAVCPTCEQEVDIEKFRSKVGLLETDLTAKAEELKVLHAVLEELEKQVWKDRREEGDLYHEAEAIRKRMETTQKSIDQMLQTMEQVERTIDSVDEETTKLIEECEARIAAWQAELQGMVRELRAKEALQKALVYWRTSFPQIRTKALDSVLEYLNHRLQYYCSVLSDSAEVVQIVLEKDKIRLETNLTARAIKATHGVRSSGERRRVDLAIQFALSDLAALFSPHGHPSLLILDEVLDTLDPMATNRILTLLNEIAEERSIMVTTHSSDVRQALGLDTSVFVVRKQGGVSTLEVA